MFVSKLVLKRQLHQCLARDLVSSEGGENERCLRRWDGPLRNSSEWAQALTRWCSLNECETGSVVIASMVVMNSESERRWGRWDTELESSRRCAPVSQDATGGKER